jgi:hypothetical protein
MEKKCILTAYWDKFGLEYPESIATRKKGKNRRALFKEISIANL